MAKASLNPNFKEFLGLLNSASVRYLVLGGYAVNYYGYHRSTGDLDIWIALDSQNATKLSEVLRVFGGFSSRQVSPSLLQQKGRIFQFGHPPVRIDLLTAPSGVEFDQCYQRRHMDIVDGVEIPFIALPDLELLKK